MLSAGWSVEEIEVLDSNPESGECSFTAGNFEKMKWLPIPVHLYCAEPGMCPLS
jgi:hypothetical protein